MTTTARSAPGGVKPDDGFSSLIAFAADPDISFWEKTVKPPGLDGGEPIDTTTMHNTSLRTMGPRSLATMTPFTTKVTYDPEVYDQILAIINTAGWVTVHFWDGSTIDFYGYLQKFEPDDLSEGAQPEATVTIVPTNTVPATGAESSLTYTAPAT